MKVRSFVNTTHRHLRNIECLMGHTTCLFCLISMVNGCSKKRKKRSLLRVALVAGTQQNLSSLYYFDVFMIPPQGAFKWYGRIKYRQVTSNALITFGIRHHYPNNECKKICKQQFRVLRCKCYIIQLYKPQISKEYRLLKVCCVPATSATTSKAFSLFCSGH